MNDLRSGLTPLGVSPKYDSENIDFESLQNLSLALVSKSKSRRG